MMAEGAMGSNGERGNGLVVVMVMDRDRERESEITRDTE